MNARFTPGPWRSSEPNGCGNGWRAGPAWLGYDAHSERTANDARLIAAAPEMLDALERAVNLYGNAPGPWSVPSDPGAWITQARAAIAKATGEAT